MPAQATRRWRVSSDERHPASGNCRAGARRSRWSAMKSAVCCSPPTPGRARTFSVMTSATLAAGYPAHCACGLTSPRFELLQRHGKLIRIGTDFISLSELAGHLQAPFQLHAGSRPRRPRTHAGSQPRRPRRHADPTARVTRRWPRWCEAGFSTLEVEACDPQHFDPKQTQRQDAASDRFAPLTTNVSHGQKTKKRTP